MTETEAHFNKDNFYSVSLGPSTHIATLTNDSFLDFPASQSEPMKMDAQATEATVYKKNPLLSGQVPSFGTKL